MPSPYEKLRAAFEEKQHATVTKQDGTVHEDCVVEDFTHVQTDYFEIWRFILCRGDSKNRVFGPDLKTVELRT
jgi:hypothetical protein